MALLILCLMIGVPIVEIAVFIKVGGFLGLGPTLAIVVVTAIMGTALLRHQGLATLMSARDSLMRGRFPIAEVFDGLCLMVAGALLLTPGFVTDAVGLVLFVPAARAVLRRVLGHYLVSSGRVEAWTVGPGGPTRRSGADASIVIDGEYDEVDEPPDRGPNDGPGRPPGALPR